MLSEMTNNFFPFYGGDSSPKTKLFDGLTTMILRVISFMTKQIVWQKFTIAASINNRVIE